MSHAIAAQAQRVRAAYASTGSVNPDYAREFDALAEMRRASMADLYRKARGLPPSAETPYDSSR